MSIRHIPHNEISVAVETFGAGEPLLFAHGLQGTRKLMRAQMAPLADRFRIIIFDQRGHGDSSPLTDSAQYDPHVMAEDVTAVMDAFGIERAIVGGESMGAATVTLFALAHPERVEKLLLTAPAFGDQPNSERQRLNDLGAGMQKLGMPEFLKLAAVRQRELFGWSPEAIEVVGEMIGTHQPESLGTALQTVCNWEIVPDLQVLANIRCPVCVIGWDGDPLHPLELARRYVSTMPDARLVLFPSLPEIFIHPSRIGEIYRDFLTQP